LLKGANSAILFFVVIADRNQYSPPANRDGTPIPDRSGWQRSAIVEYVDANDLGTTVGTDQGVKRITVTVKRNDNTVAELVGIRTNAGQDDG